MRLAVFGERPSEVSNLSYCVEHAFDVHRQRLISIMERLGTISQQLLATDSVYQHLFEPVHSRMMNISSLIPQYWEHNEMVLRELINPAEVPFTYAILDSPAPLDCPEGTKEQDKDLSSYNSLVQVLIHINRDWTMNGQEVRSRLYYDGILNQLSHYLPPLSSGVKVLVPGAGLGRLAFDTAERGYHVEANECSAAMLCASYSIISSLLPEGQSRHIFPNLHYPLHDDWDLELRVKPSSFPFMNDSISSGTASMEGFSRRLTFQYGDFVSIYKTSDFSNIHFHRFDGVLTSFFIDTGRSLLEYLEVIRHVLRDNGIWINAGPLHYHNPVAVPYSYKDMMQIIQLIGFELLHEERITMSYCGEEEQSMKPEVYAIPLAVFRKLPDSSSVVKQNRSHEYLSHPNYVIKR